MYEWFIRWNQTGQSVVSRCKVLHFSSSTIFGYHWPCSPHALFPLRDRKTFTSSVICVSVALRVSGWNVCYSFFFESNCRATILDLNWSEMWKFPWNINKYSVSTICRLKWKHFAIEQTRVHSFCKQFSSTAFVYIAFAYEIEILVFSVFHDERLLLGNNKNKSIRSIHCWRV